MATFIMLCILCIFLYVAVVFLLYPSEQGQTTKKNESDPVKQNENTDIMGKSTFDVNAELLQMRQRQEEANRKAAIAKGEMTEDGKEIAQEVRPEDCEVEQKKVWTQVPTEQLDDMFSEPEDSDEPRAQGATIDDVDLAFQNIGRDDLTEEEEHHAVTVFKELKGTELLDAVEHQFADIGARIDSLIDKYSEQQTKETVIPSSFEDFKLSDYL